MSEAALHLTSFLVGFLVFSSLHIVIGEQVPKTLAIRKPEPVSLWVAYPLHVSYVLFYPLNWLLNASSRAILGRSASRNAPQHEILTNVEIEDLVERLGRARQDADLASRVSSTTSSASATSQSATSWSIAPRWRRSMPTTRRRRSSLRCSLLNLPGCRSGVTRPRTSSASCTRRICCAPSRPRTAISRRSTSRSLPARPGSCRTSARSRSNSRRFAAARRTSRSWSTSMAR